MLNCPLCYSNQNSEIKQSLMRCLNCDLVFKTEIVNHDKEKKRYQEHNNDLEDKGYLSYLDKLLKTIEEFIKIDSKIKMLDFGSGPTKGLEAVVKSRKLNSFVYSYDPYFFKLDLDSFQKTFDIVFASECFEHFNNPELTIKKIVNVLKVEGILAVGTYLHGPDTDFSSWWYLKDPTHIVFYSHKTINYLRDKFNLDLIYSDQTRFLLKKK